MIILALVLGILHLTLGAVRAATADDWRSRSIYQLITDRFAPATPGAPCNTADRVYCGGTWATVMSQLDYIQGMGFDAVWISPTHLQIEGNTVDGEAYHGYWPIDQTQLNPHFGTQSDLLALSAAIHDRGMYFLADLALADVVSLSTNISNAALQQDSGGALLFQQESDFNPACQMQFGNRTSEMICWLETSGVCLMDLNVDNEAVSSIYLDWIPTYISTYNIDGLRIDMGKCMSLEFQHTFCETAGVFCITEIADSTQYAATFQGPQGVDSVFGFGMCSGFQSGFTGTSPSISTFASLLALNSIYPDPTVVVNFLDNQDEPRFNSLTNDTWMVYNAIVGNILVTGIPAVYYGLEQDIADGPGDPANREALWLYNDFSTTATPTYARIANLNAIRNYLGSVSTFHTLVATVSAMETNDIALQRGDLLLVLTNRGEKGTGSWTISNTTFMANEQVIDLLSCTWYMAATNKSITVTWTTGQPFAFVPVSVASGSNLCGFTGGSTTTTTPSSTAMSSTAPISSASPSVAGSAPATTTTPTTTTTVTPTTDNAASSPTSSTDQGAGGNAFVGNQSSSTASATSSDAATAAEGGASSSSMSASSSSPSSPRSSPTRNDGSLTSTPLSTPSSPASDSDAGSGSSDAGSSTSTSASPGTCTRGLRKRLQHRAHLLPSLHDRRVTKERKSPA